MLKRFRGLVVGGMVISVVLTMAACGRSGDVDELEPVKQAVRESSSAFDEVFVEEGLDGFSRYLFVEMGVSDSEITADVLAEALRAIGNTIPDGFESARIIVRTESGDRLDLEEPLAATGVDAVFMISPKTAKIPAEALRSFGGDAE
ncbi:hypothetical protein [Agromyces subbeticus]|uniref:hypothetical protein n=1 Tax=Agromyces subbeticus TaxID=293890 RepID=UPI0012EC4D14|nr:hypothetical protein [Agromyces subbeticus]